MKYLLDTHTLLWFLNADDRLASRPLLIIKDWESDCSVSIASIWEIAIKISLNKLELKVDFGKLASTLNENRIGVLPLTFNQIQVLLTLEYHRKDPFDRMIIAQAIIDNMTLISRDEIFEEYAVKTLWK